MSYKIAILSLMALQALTVTALPPCTCTRNLQPVCGSDGNTYGNECLLNCQRNIYVVSEGPCDDSVKVAEVPCYCPGFLQEVCGTDGNTYDNSCKLNCATAKDNTLGIKYQGKCDNTVNVAEVPCVCPDVIEEVCGTDGNTYDNSCILNCETAKDSMLGIKYQGKCDNTVNVAEVPCVCPDVIEEVCGTDGNTYDNSCILNCETAKDSMLGIKYQGKCDNTVNVAEVPCVCPDVIEEVCGTDGNTYDNSCILNCETAKDSMLGIKYQGKCEKPKCTCPKELKPVCGTDGVTYGNQCLVGCAGAHVSLAKYGPC